MHFQPIFEHVDHLLRSQGSRRRLGTAPLPEDRLKLLPDRGRRRGRCRSARRRRAAGERPELWDGFPRMPVGGAPGRRRVRLFCGLHVAERRVLAVGQMQRGRVALAVLRQIFRHPGPTYSVRPPGSAVRVTPCPMSVPPIVVVFAGALGWVVDASPAGAGCEGAAALPAPSPIHGPVSGACVVPLLSRSSSTRFCRRVTASAPSTFAFVTRARACPGLAPSSSKCPINCLSASENVSAPAFGGSVFGGSVFGGSVFGGSAFGGGSATAGAAIAGPVAVPAPVVAAAAAGGVERPRTGGPPVRVVTGVGPVIGSCSICCASGSSWNGVLAAGGAVPLPIRTGGPPLRVVTGVVPCDGSISICCASGSSLNGVGGTV